MTKSEILAHHRATAIEADPTGRSASEGVGARLGGMGEHPPTPTPTDPHPTPTAAPMVPPGEVLRRADAALDAARFEHRQAKLVLADARQHLNAARAAYNAANPPLSPEANVRQWIASNQARKRQLAEAGRVPYRPSVTETARAMSGGGHGNDIRTMRGGGAAYRRGPGGVQAFTKTQAQTITAQRLRDKAAKLPSER